MSADVGRTYGLFYAFGAETVNPGTLTFVQLGMCQGKEWATEFETVDATGDTSPGLTKQNLVTFRNVSMSFDGIAMGPAEENQKALADAVETGTDPRGWLRLVGGGLVRTCPVIFKSWKLSAAHADAVKFSGEAMSNGQQTKVAV